MTAEADETIPSLGCDLAALEHDGRLLIDSRRDRAGAGARRSPTATPPDEAFAGALEEGGR